MIQETVKDPKAWLTNGSNLITVSIKLSPALLQFRPETYTGNPFELSISAASSLAEVIETVVPTSDIAQEMTLMSIVNDTLIMQEQRQQTLLKHLDCVALMSPVEAERA